MQITRKTFDEQRSPRFGATNPERMQFAFWEWMIRGATDPAIEGEGVFKRQGMMMREGTLKSAHGPHHARDFFGISARREDGPIWTFDRMGATCTPLEDGRFVYVGGEHEDYYDPDFFIYNDVVVIGNHDDIEIYGYPKEDFPPTDFHTATLVGRAILIIGRLGYSSERRPGFTPVYSLDLTDFRMSEIKTSGEMPGWLFKHKATLASGGIINIRGGETVEGNQTDRFFRKNLDDFVFDLGSSVWRRLTRTNWCQFSIRRIDRALFVLESRPKPEALLPSAMEYKLVSTEWNGVRFSIEDISITVTVEVDEVTVVIEGQLGQQLLEHLTEEIRANVSAATKAQCVLRPL